MWWFSFEGKNLVSIHKQSSPVFPAPHLVSLGVHHSRTACMMDEHIYWAPVGSGLIRKHHGECNSCGPLPSCFLGDWRQECIRHLTYDHLMQSVVQSPKCKGPESDQSLPRESSVTAGVCCVRWCRQIMWGAVEDTKPGRGGGVSKVSRWQEPEWAVWGLQEGWRAWGAESKSGDWDKAVAIRPPHAHFLYTFLFCYASSKFYPSSTEYFV